MLFSPAINWRLARDIKQFAAIVTAESAKGRRRIRRPESGETNLRRRALERIGGNGQTIDVRGLALIGRHAIGGIALDVLDGMKPFAHGQTNILGCYIVLEIDESLGFARIAIRWQFAAAHTITDKIACNCIFRRFGFMTCIIGCSSTACAPSRNAACKSKLPLPAPAQRLSSVRSPGR